jgi:hypothetical protein
MRKIVFDRMRRGRVATGASAFAACTALVLAACLLCLAPVASAHAQPRVELATAAAGLGVTHAPHKSTIGPQWWQTGGAAAGDFNRDGFADLFVVSGGGGPDRLFINQGDGTFVDEANAWGLTAVHAGNGVAVADVDRDGRLDLYVSSFGPVGSPAAPGHNRLYRNLGTGFVEEGALRGVAWASPTAATAYGAAFGDYDRDGDLDLFVASWSKSGDGNRLYENGGDGTFLDVTAQALPAGSLSGVWGFQPAFADIDGDGWPELLLAADFGTSRFFLNQKNGTFANATGAWRAGQDTFGMGVAVADFNDDGHLDWYVTSIYEENAGPDERDGNLLYVNRRTRFVEVSNWAGVNDGGWGWGAAAADLDHDGYLDIVATEGREAVGGEWENEQTKLFHRRAGRFRFDEIATAAGLDHFKSGRAVVTLDADRDGDLDLVLTTNDAPLAYYRNVTSPSGHWLRVALDTSAHPDLPPDGFGTRVTVHVGARRLTRYLDGGPSYLGTSELVLHFGLGAATVVDRIDVVWADAEVTQLYDVPADQAIVVTRPAP